MNSKYACQTKMTSNMIYLATADGFDSVKIGYWRTDYVLLENKCRSIFGNAVEIRYYDVTTECDYFHKVINCVFVQHKHAENFYARSQMQEYIKFIEDNIDKSRRDLSRLFRKQYANT